MNPAASRAARESPTAVLDAVAVVARLLDALAAAPQGMGVSALARRLAESKARVHRNLVSLKHFGLVDQEPASDRYRLGWRFVHLGDRASRQFDLHGLAEPYLKRLRDLTGQSVLLSVPVNGEALVIAAVETDRHVNITVRPGNRPPPHCSAQGRIALAWASKADRDRGLVRPLRALTPQSLVSPATVARRLGLIRERLFEEAPNEALTGVNVLAAPILRREDWLVGMVGIIGSIQDVPTPPATVQRRLVQGTAAALSEILGDRTYRARGIHVPAALRSPRGDP